MPPDNGRPSVPALLSSRLYRPPLPRVVLPEGYVWDETVEASSWDDAQKLITNINWLVDRWIPLGMLLGVVGEPKRGKSAWVLHALVRPIITGCNWFTGAFNQSPPGFVVWCDTEFSLSINLDRAKMWNLPLERIKCWSDDPLEHLDLMNDSHLERLENVILKYEARVAVIDSLRGAHSKDENQSVFMSKALKPLGEVAQRTNSVPAVVHHTKKIGCDEEINVNSGRGANTFLAMMRTQIAIDQPDPESEWHRVQVLGHNIGVSPRPIGFRWTDNGLEYGDAPTRPIKQKQETGTDRAVAWLRERMNLNTWYAAATLESEAVEAGFSKTGALQRAREALGITKDKGNVERRDRVWVWRRSKKSPG